MLQIDRPGSQDFEMLSWGLFIEVMASPDCNYIKIAMGKLIFEIPDSPPLLGGFRSVDDL